ncbi:MAG: hypothetical protein QOH06_3611 [Acidobacteriota bacterium]|jgi:hypothetical protein|nr:hypothetical protein [Acidobacteriota bacterium]
MGDLPRLRCERSSLQRLRSHPAQTHELKHPWGGTATTRSRLHLPWGRVSSHQPREFQTSVGTATLPPTRARSALLQDGELPPSSLTQTPPLLRALVVAPEQLLHPARPPGAPPSPQPPWGRQRPPQIGSAALRRTAPPSLGSASAPTATSYPQGRVGRAGDCGRNDRPPFLRRAHPISRPPALFHFPRPGPRNVPWHSGPFPRPPARELPAPGSGGVGATRPPQGGVR